NNITGVCARLGSTVEGISTQAAFFAIYIYAPHVDGAQAKMQANLTRPALIGQAYPGDLVQYQIAIENNGADAAKNVVLTDAIPAGTTYVPGSLVVATGANAGAKTDAAGDDQAEVSGSTITFRLGQGANASVGGQLGEAGSLALATGSMVSFQVRVNDSTVGNVANQAHAAYASVTTSDPFTAETNQVTLQVLPSTLVLNTTTIGGVAGPFIYTLSGTAQTTGNASTASAGVAVQVDGDSATAGVQSYAVATGVGLVITQAGLPAGWTLAGAACTRDGVAVGSLVGATYTIAAADAYGALVCNFSNAAPGSLAITKLISGGPAGGVTGSFGFSADCGAAGTFTGTVVLAGATTGTGGIVGIPAGASCTVSESGVPTAPTGYAWAGLPAAQTVAVSSATASMTSFTNALRSLQPVPAMTRTMLLALSLLVLLMAGALWRSGGRRM
ncbi:MAG TPA: DUF5979 domain-containing protein, partial [Burkholderiaceae bacterium]